METLTSLLEALAWPEFPTETWARGAFVTAVVCLVFGLALMAAPGRVGGWLGLVGKATRPSGIGELRPAGGFIAGLALAALLFFDQPVMVTILGVALAFATFARLISLMSDTSASLLNLLLLLVQGAMAVAALAFFFQVVTPDFVLGVPVEFNPQLVFFTFASIAGLGAIILFAPRIAMSTAGLWVAETRPGGIASIRSAGGFLVGAGLFGMAVAGLWESAMIVLLMACFGFAAALYFSIVGRVLSMVFNRGNLVYSAIALIVQACAAGLVTLYIASVI